MIAEVIDRCHGRQSTRKTEEKIKSLIFENDRMRAASTMRKLNVMCDSYSYLMGVDHLFITNKQQ